jgi:hypothetical protein
MSRTPAMRRRGLDWIGLMHWMRGALLAHLALLILSALERLRDDVFAEHDPGLRHLLDGKQNLARFARRGIVAADACGRPFGAHEQAAEPAPALDPTAISI